MTTSTIRASLSASRKRRAEAEKERKEKAASYRRGNSDGRKSEREYLLSLIRTRHLPPPPTCKFDPDVEVVRVFVEPEPELLFERRCQSPAVLVAFVVEFRRKTMVFDAGNGRTVTWDQWEPCGRAAL